MAARVGDFSNWPPAGTRGPPMKQPPWIVQGFKRAAHHGFKHPMWSGEDNIKLPLLTMVMTQLSTEYTDTPDFISVTTWDAYPSDTWYVSWHFCEDGGWLEDFWARLGEEWGLMQLTPCHFDTGTISYAAKKNEPMRLRKTMLQQYVRFSLSFVACITILGAEVLKFFSMDHTPLPWLIHGQNISDIHLSHILEPHSTWLKTSFPPINMVKIDAGRCWPSPNHPKAIPPDPPVQYWI